MGAGGELSRAAYELVDELMGWMRGLEGSNERRDEAVQAALDRFRSTKSYQNALERGKESFLGAATKPSGDGGN